MEIITDQAIAFLVFPHFKSFMRSSIDVALLLLLGTGRDALWGLEAVECSLVYALSVWVLGILALRLGSLMQLPI